jgi:hypothetical protein
MALFFLGDRGESEKLPLGHCLQALGPSLAQDRGISMTNNKVTRNLRTTAATTLEYGSRAGHLDLTQRPLL